MHGGGNAVDIARPAMARPKLGFKPLHGHILRLRRKQRVGQIVSTRGWYGFTCYERVRGARCGAEVLWARSTMEHPPAWGGDTGSTHTVRGCTHIEAVAIVVARDQPPWPDLGVPGLEVCEAAVVCMVAIDEEPID